MVAEGMDLLLRRRGVRREAEKERVASSLSSLFLRECKDPRTTAVQRAENEKNKGRGRTTGRRLGEMRTGPRRQRNDWRAGVTAVPEEGSPTASVRDIRRNRNGW